MSEANDTLPEAWTSASLKPIPARTWGADFAKALCMFQSKASGAAKKATNPHFKAKYADLSAVLDAIREPMAEAGLAFTQFAETDDRQSVCITTMIMHETGEYMQSTLCVPVSKGDAQGLGSAITYGKRYALQAMLGVPSEDDDGNAAVQKVTKPAVTPEARQMAISALHEVAKTKGEMAMIDEFKKLPPAIAKSLTDHEKSTLREVGQAFDRAPQDEMLQELETADG